MDTQSRICSVLLKGAVLFLLAITSSHCLDMSCPCTESNLCKPVKKVISKDPEVYVFSRGTSSVHLWKWDAIDTLVVPHDFKKSDMLQSETLCFTHGQGKKFGITVEFDLSTEEPGTINRSRDDAESWRVGAYLKQTAWFADVITIDLLPYFKADKASGEEDHAFLAGVLLGLHKELPNTEIICVVPWKPPCTKKEGSCHFAMLARDACNYFILNPDSFLDTSDNKCVARANIPFTKLLYGISEYNAHHIPASRMILGVTWHGYDYTCSSLVGDICNLTPSRDANGSVTEDFTCHYDQRKRVSYGDIIRYHSTEFASHKQEKLYNAPFFNYKKDSVNHQIWYEDHESLKGKYQLAHKLQLKGIAILYGDDLSPTKLPHYLSNEGFMWSWLSHEVLLKSTKKPEHHDLHWAGARIFGLIEAEFNAHSIPWENCLALGSDNANVMVGKQSGLYDCMLKKHPEMYLSGCVCHLIHIAAEKDTVAGVAVGCFLLGVLLGVIFTCISMQKRVKKPRQPFQGDMDPLGTDYTDDPDL